MKRIICTVLIAALLVSYCPISASADEPGDYHFRNICVMVDKDGAFSEMMIPVIVKDGEIFVMPEVLQELTRYRLTTDENRLIYSLGMKSLLIDLTGQTLQVNLTQQPFTGSLFLDGTHYLPMSELLPWMNVQCYTDGHRLHIDSDVRSYWEVVADFDYQDYFFDLAATYGESAGDVAALCSITIFDWLMDLGSCWKKVAKVDNSSASLYEYEIYKECFRSIVLPDTGSAAELHAAVSDLEGVVSAGSQSLNSTFEAIYTDDTAQKIAEVFGEDFAVGWDDIPYDAARTAEDFALVSKLLKYTKTSYLYARIAMEDTADYADTLRYIYLQGNTKSSDGARTAADTIVPVLESQAGALMGAADTILTDIVSSSIEEAAEEAVESLAGDRLVGSLGTYLGIVDATLSLVWPINEAYSEVSKMAVYQDIQYDAMSAYFNIPTHNAEVTAQDLCIGRTSALIFLKTAKKCFQAQQALFDFYGGKGVLDLQIELINKKILEFELSSLAEERDAIVDKSADAKALRDNWSAFILLDTANNGNADDLIGDWYYYQDTEYEYTDLISRLTFYEDGSARLLLGYYATDMIYAFDGGWELLSGDGGSFLIRLDGMAGYQSVGETDVAPYTADIRITLNENLLLIENVSTEDAYWLDNCWHEKDLDYYVWLDRTS